MKGVICGEHFTKAEELGSADSLEVGQARAPVTRILIFEQYGRVTVQAVPLWEVVLPR